MTLYGALCFLAALLIAITALARLNDIRPLQKSKRWWLRRVGLLFVFVGMTMFMAAYFTPITGYWDDVRRVLTMYGFLFTMMTTPSMPPWWAYIARNDQPGETHDRRVP